MNTLSERLQVLKNLAIIEPYHHIWDCCCDHGYLGFAILEQTVDTHIHFVDNVPHIIQNLEDEITKRYHCNSRFDEQIRVSSYCMSAAEIPLNEYHHSKHLVIIAGIGGELMADLIEEILKKNDTLTSIDMLVCPVNRIVQLRKQLTQLNLGVKQEVLIQEGKYFYEGLLLTTDNNYTKVAETGSLLWQYNTNQTNVKLNYLHQLIRYHEQVLYGLKQKQNRSNNKSTETTDSEFLQKIEETKKALNLYRHHENTLRAYENKERS